MAPEWTACAVRGDALKQEDVTAVPAADGGRETARGVGDERIELAEVFLVVIDPRDRHDDGVLHGCFGGGSRCDAGGGAHGGDGGDGGSVGDSGGLDVSVVLKVEAITVRLHRG